MSLAHNTVAGLVNAVYLGITNGVKPDQYFLDRTILSPKNDAVDDLNHYILDKFPGEKVVLTSADKVIG
ncbi:hypothetical protein FOMPIDRAFT_1083319, partial [Fomitopsis schrenkii]